VKLNLPLLKTKMSERNLPASPLLSRRRLLALGAAAAGTLAGLSARQAVAQTKLTVTEGTLRPLPIALPDFVTEPGVPDPGMGRNITQIIAANLRRSGMFAPIDQAAYVERISDINRNPRFPEGVNVSWAIIRDPHHIDLNVYERGVGFTLACGTAATATAAVAINQGKCEGEVVIKMPGGECTVEWPNQSH
jgi:hypothetical protein